MRGEWKNSFETVANSSRRARNRALNNRKDTSNFMQPTRYQIHPSLGFAISSAAPEPSVRNQNHPARH